MLSNKTPLRHRYAMPSAPGRYLLPYGQFTLSPQGEAFTTSCTIQNLQSYGLCGILDIEKDNRPQRWVAELVKKNPLRARQSQGAVFLCP